jgi:DNA-binding NtrC family response regulator
VVSLHLPDLSQRREDIPLLIDHIVSKFNQLQGKDIEGISEGAMARLMEYEFPGNVRELENIIEQAFVLCRDRTIALHHLPAELRPVAAGNYAGPGPMSLESMEKLLISEALRRHKGNRTKAARQLGINPSTLYRKMKVLDISANDENA